MTEEGRDLQAELTVADFVLRLNRDCFFIFNQIFTKSALVYA